MGPSLKNPFARTAIRFAVLLLVFLFSPGGTAPGAAQGLEVGDKAVPFTGTDLAGQTVDIGPLLGKQVLVLKFGSIYCSSCVKSIANLAELQKKNPEDRLKVVGINLDIYGTFRVKRFYNGYKSLVNFPILIDRDLEISRRYGVTTLPSLVIIDRKGRISRKMVGYQESELEKMIRHVRRLVDDTGKTELASAVSAGAGPVNLILPTNFSKTQQDSINIIGITSRVGSKVRMTLNGGSVQEMIARRPIFYFRTPVSLGSNYIEVSMDDEGGARKSQAVVLFRDPKLGRGFQTQFPTYHFHVRENEESCEACHELAPPESSERNFLMVTRGCLECHTELARKNYVHGPIPVGGCSPCHDFASRPERYDLFTTGAELCYSCHEEKRSEFARSFIHGPLAAGVCSVCHSPHGSNEKYQLRLPEGQMCMLCHQQIRQAGYLSSQHAPFEDGRCSGCHNPHSSVNPEFFLEEPGNGLCARCHGGKQMETHRHSSGTVPTHTFPGIKLTEEGETTCLSCHNPHATDSPFLLPEKGCNACHSY